MSQWIWKFGEFEVYHNLLLHNRRQAYGFSDPPVWKLYAPEPVVRFKKRFNSQGGAVKVTACGSFITDIKDISSGNTIASYRGINDIELPQGDIEMVIRVANPLSFPCVMVEGAVQSDGSWLADDVTGDWARCGTWDRLCNRNITPDVFPFSYKPIKPVSKQTVMGGALFDFGKETFARTKITQIGDGAMLYFGESKEEALDKEWSVIRFKLTPENGETYLPAYAFRYVYIDDPNAKIEAEYEYLPLEYKGDFKGDELLKRIWDTAAYTFHLNCREFILDGIKRDRWVWSADAYQSLFVNHYLFADKALERRTLTALGGKSPVKQYINTIMDYTFFWIIGLYEYYLAYGDKDFLEQIFPTAKEHIEFFCNRRDDDGFIRGKGEDWVFIDWAQLDKTGALLGEQVLMAKALSIFGKICDIVGCSDAKWEQEAAVLQKNIFNKFLDTKKGVSIDSYESGKNNVTRHSNILAYLFLPCSDELKKSIYNNVVCNDQVPAITTPYFKFYENKVHADRGNIVLLEGLISDYYGGMLSTGATTLYEEFDPTKKGVQHYKMYGRPFEKSLCHAWSTSPIYLLGRYRAGVQNTGVGYDTFEVAPFVGDGKAFESTVPLPNGYVKVNFNGKTVKVLTNCAGGVFKQGEKEITLEPDKELVYRI